MFRFLQNMYSNNDNSEEKKQRFIPLLNTGINKIPSSTKLSVRFESGAHNIVQARTNSNVRWSNKAFVPIGDHCTIPEILIELNLRTCSFPFDWTARPGLLDNSNIHYNMYIIDQLYRSKGDIQTITELYLGDFFENEDHVNLSNKIWFPHEEGTKEEIFAKYERRFARLYNTLINRENIFFILNRNIYISSKEMEMYLNILLKCNPRNHIVFISGKPHPYLLNPNYKYRKNITFQHIFYDVNKFPDYDYTDFRPRVRTFLRDFFF